MLVFGQPWHLPPDWGDVPTWLAALFAGIAGVVALRQLGMLRQQMADEAERSAKRDEIFDSQVTQARNERRLFRLIAFLQPRAPSINLTCTNASLSDCRRTTFVRDQIKLADLRLYLRVVSLAQRAFSSRE
jgi:hypothetical protein